MDILIIVLISLYLVAFASYIYMVKLGRNYYRAANKIILALLYLALAIIAFATKAYKYSFFIALLVGLSFTFLGDIVLMVKFNIGAGLFTIGNISILIFELLLLDYNHINFVYYFPFIILAIALCLIYKQYLIKSKTIKKEDFNLSIGYLFFVSLHGFLSIFAAFILKNSFIIIFSIGSSLFMISDYILVKYVYSLQPKLLDQRVNTLFYFSGILLICCSMFLI